MWKSCDLDYAEDFVRQFESAEYSLSASDRASASFGMRFAPLKCKVMLQRSGKVVPDSILHGVTNNCRLFHLPRQLSDEGWRLGRSEHGDIQCSSA